MNAVNYDNQIILHCGNCGGSFFEENGINRITSDSAYQLSNDKKSDEISGQEKKCPKDQFALTPITNDQAIPAEITLLQCLKCHGVFIFPDDLVQFKKAQEIKIDYFKIWGMPLPSLRAVVVLSFVAMVSALAFSRFILFQKYSLEQARASDLINRVELFQSEYYRFISFFTPTPLLSRIIVRNTQGKIVTKMVSEKPSKLHFTTISDFDQKDALYYQIFLIDEKGKWVKTNEMKFESSK